MQVLCFDSSIPVRRQCVITRGKTAKTGHFVTNTGCLSQLSVSYTLYASAFMTLSKIYIYVVTCVLISHEFVKIACH